MPGQHSCDVFLGIVISQLADVDQRLPCINKNVDRERIGKIEKYLEDVRVLCSDPDSLDRRHCSLDVLYVDDNSHISFFMAGTDLW